MQGNCKAIIDGLNSARPAATKGVFIKRATITSTMGPGLRLDPRETA